MTRTFEIEWKQFFTALIFAIAACCFAAKAWAIAGVDFPYEDDLDFTPAHEAIDAGNYEEAIAFLDIEVLEWYPENPEGLTLKAYALRSMGEHEAAMDYYNQALTSDPEHQGALEYQGELYLILNNREAAEANLAKLEALCPVGCEALEKLQVALERHKDGNLTWVAPSERHAFAE